MNYEEFYKELTDLIGNLVDYQSGFTGLYGKFVDASKEEKNAYDIALTESMPKAAREVFNIMLNTTFINSQNKTEKLPLNTTDQTVKFVKSLHESLLGNKDKVISILRTTDEAKGAHYLSTILKNLRESDVSIRKNLEVFSAK